MAPTGAGFTFLGTESVKPLCLYRLSWLLMSRTTTYCKKLHKMAPITPRLNPGALLSSVAVRGTVFGWLLASWRTAADQADDRRRCYEGRGLMDQALGLIAMG
jgi:hypothetical protein